MMPHLGLITTRAGQVLLVLGALLLLCRWFEWKSLYMPFRELEGSPADLGLKYEDIQFVAEDGALLHGWWIPHAQARGTLLHCHGNAGNISHRLDLAADLHRLQVNVFLFDYRGYGRSRGLPTEQGTYRDARAAYEFVRAQYGDQEQPPVIAHGQSLGGAVAVQLARDVPLRGLIVESCFSSTLDMARLLYPWLPARWLCGFRYDARSKVGRLTLPKLFAHSPQDEMIPYALGRELFAAAAEPKRFCALRGGHNEAGWQLSPEYWQEIEQFVQELFGPPSQ